mgnify:CR=1 FL=1
MINFIGFLKEKALYFKSFFPKLCLLLVEISFQCLCSTWRAGRLDQAILLVLLYSLILWYVRHRFDYTDFYFLWRLGSKTFPSNIARPFMEQNWKKNVRKDQSLSPAMRSVIFFIRSMTWLIPQDVLRSSVMPDMVVGWVCISQVVVGLQEDIHIACLTPFPQCIPLL